MMPFCSPTILTDPSQCSPDPLRHPRPHPSDARDRQSQSTKVGLDRFDRPVSDQRFIALVNHVVGWSNVSRLPELMVSDTLFYDGSIYIDVISPVDVVVGRAHPTIEDLIDVTTADELEAVFDGGVNAPPRPVRSRP